MDECEVHRRMVADFVRRNIHWFGLLLLLISLTAGWYIWGVWGVKLLAYQLCGAQEECKKIETLGAIGDIFGGINALFAALALGAVAYGTFLTRKANSEEREWTRDEKYVEQIKLSYLWAYDVLTDKGRMLPPAADNINWLTCARHIARAQRIEKLIKTKAHWDIHEEHREFWRHQFYLALDFPDLREASYYEGYQDQRFGRMSVNSLAALIIVDFSDWKSNNDPIDAVNQPLLIENLQKGWSHVKVGLRARMEKIDNGLI